MNSVTHRGLLVGVFDMFGIEDLDLIAAARARCARLDVAVASDEVAMQLRGSAPVIPMAERIAILAAVRGSAQVLPWLELDVAGLAESAQAGVLFADARWSGADWIARLDRPVELLTLTRHSSAAPGSRAIAGEDVA